MISYHDPKKAIIGVFSLSSPCRYCAFTVTFATAEQGSCRTCTGVEFEIDLVQGEEASRRIWKDARIYTLEAVQYVSLVG